VSPSELDYQTVFELATSQSPESQSSLQFWWDNRITFPYPDSNGTYRYLIARATPDTADCVRDSDIVDWTTRDTSTHTIRFTSAGDGTLSFQPPAVAVSPGDTVTFTTPFDIPLSFRVEYSTADAWESGQLQSLSPQPCPQGGTYQFEVCSQTLSQPVRGAVLATQSFDPTHRISPLADWLAQTPQYSPTQAKYLKQTKSKPWVDSTAIYEPLYGLSTVEPGNRLLITEGITDAIAAHEHGIPCVSPVTTQFKEEHHSALIDVATAASEVIVLMDTDLNKAGINGALTLAQFLTTHNIAAQVAQLPRPSGSSSVDLAEFLNRHSRAELVPHLESAVSPQSHPHYDPDIHSPSGTQSTGAPSSQTSSSPTQTTPPPHHSSDTQPSTHHPSTPATTTSKSAHDSSRRTGSALFDLTLFDVSPSGTLGSTTPSSSSPSSVVRRTSNPFFSESPPQSFILLTPSLAYEHWAAVKDSYTPLTYLACDAGIRDPRSPSGPVSAQELWQLWKTAVTTPYVTYPKQSHASHSNTGGNKEQSESPSSQWQADPVPRRAMWHLARKHSLTHTVPSDVSTPGDTPKLPRSLYNQVLELIMNTYGLDPGRTIQS